MIWLIRSLLIFHFITTCFITYGQCDGEDDIPSGICCEGCTIPAPILCDINDLDGYCGRTGDQSPNPEYDGFCGPNTVTDNPSWFGFVSSGGNITIQLTVSNCLMNRGVQFAIYNGCSGNPPVTCQSSCQGGSGDEIIVLTVPNTIPGNTYYVMIDGCRTNGIGDQCDYLFSILEGEGPEIGELTEPDGPTLACPGQTFEYNFPDVYKATTYVVTMPDGSTFTTNDNSFTYNFPEGTPPGNYQFCLDLAANACDTVFGPNCIDIEVQPLPVVLEGPFLICNHEWPITVRDIDYYEPGIFEYIVSGAPECDSVIRVEIEELINEPDVETLVVCPDEFPLNSPYNSDVYPGPGVYIVPWEDERGCDSTFGLYIATTEFFFIVFTEPDSLYCENDFVEIDATNVAGIISDGTLIEDLEYSWYLNGELLFGETEDRLNAYDEGTYTLIVQGNILGVSCIDSFDIEIGRGELIIPEFAINGPAEICQQVDFQYTTELFDDFTYSWSIDHPDILLDVSNDKSSATVRATELDTFNLCLTTTSLICPDESIQTCRQIIVSEILSPPLAGDAFKCTDEEARIVVVDDFAEYNWNNGEDDKEIFVSTPGTYTVSVVDSGGCPGIASFTVGNYPEPEPTLSGELLFCHGDSTILTVNENFDMYIWSNGTTVDQCIAKNSGVFSVTVTDENGCTETASAQVEEQPELNVAIDGDPDFCTGSFVTLNTQIGFEIYEWSNGENETEIEVNTPGLVSLTVTDALGCQATDQIEIIENQLPQPEIITDRNPICPGENTELILSNEYEIVDWSTATVSESITVNEPGWFSVTVTDENGCEGTTDIEVTNYEVTDPQFSETNYYCEGGNVRVDIINSFESYLWSDNSNAPFLTINSSGNYSITVTDANSCTTTGVIEIEESPMPQPQIQGPAQLCQGEMAMLSVQNTFDSYVWSTGDDNPDISVTTSGTYEVVVTDDKGCVGTDEFSIIFNNNPVPQITGSRSFCTGFSSTLGTGNYASYEWSTEESTQSIVVNVQGNYALTVTDINGCTGEVSVNIIEADRLFPEISGLLSICDGETTELDAGVGFEIYDWSTGDSGSSILVEDPGLYSVTVTDADGCSGDVEVEVIVNENPEFEIDGINYFCPSRSTQLDAGNFSQYVWSTGSLNRTINVSQAGIYSVTVTDMKGCKGESSIAIEELDEFSPNLDGNPFFCTGATTSINVVEDYETYIWNDDINTRERIFSEEGTYTLTVEDAIGCTGSTSITIVERPLPIASAGEGGELNCTDTLITVGNLISSQGPQYNYIWERITSTATDTIASDLQFEVGNHGTYRLTVINSETGCRSIDDVVITVNDDVISDVDLLIIDPKCFGDVNGVLNINQIYGGTPPFQITLNGNSIALNQSINNLGPGSYEIFISDVNGCKWSDAFEVYTTDSLGVTIEIDTEMLIDLGDIVNFNPIVSIPEEDISNIFWWEGDRLICGGCETLGLQIAPTSEQSYLIKVEDERGCLAQDRITIFVRKRRDVYIPNAFSPNGDEVNDLFIVYGGANLLEIESIEIFDRWGNMVYLETNMIPGQEDRAWDGNFRGRELQPGAYVYSIVARFDDGEVLRYYGEVMLYR